jgi:hypothetical protein
MEVGCEPGAGMSREGQENLGRRRLRREAEEVVDDKTLASQLEPSYRLQKRPSCHLGSERRRVDAKTARRRLAALDLRASCDSSLLVSPLEDELDLYDLPIIASSRSSSDDNARQRVLMDFVFFARHRWAKAAAAALTSSLLTSSMLSTFKRTSSITYRTSQLRVS